MRKALKIASIAHIVVWIVLFAMSLAKGLMYTISSGSIVRTAVGVLYSVLLLACLHTFFDCGASKLRILKTTALWFSVLANFLHCLYIFFLYLPFFIHMTGFFYVYGDLIIAIISVDCAVISLILLIIFKVKIKKIEMSDKIGDGSLSLSVKESING